MPTLIRQSLLAGSKTVAQVFKLLIPTVLIVELLRLSGGLDILEATLAPLMNLLDLPSAFSVVWAGALLTNLYSGVAVLALVLPSADASAADVSIICAMMLIAHALPVESAISHLLGVRWWFSAALRLISAIVFALLLGWFYDQFDYLQEPASLFIFTIPPSATIAQWLQVQLSQWLIIALLIYALIFVNEALRALGIEAFLRASLAPFLRILGINQAAAGVALVGCVLGITYGGALMVNEARLGRIKFKDLALVAIFLNLAHALLEDTLLMVLAGAHLSAILWGRLIFSWVITLLFFTIYGVLERHNCLRYFFNPSISK